MSEQEKKDEGPFDWDPIKAEENIENHKISFEEAKTVFKDPHNFFDYDDEHSYDEDRYNVIGFSSVARLLIVCHCYRTRDRVKIIRIISARKANKQERKWYEQGGKF